MRKLRDTAVGWIFAGPGRRKRLALVVGVVYTMARMIVAARRDRFAELVGYPWGVAVPGHLVPLALVQSLTVQFWFHPFHPLGVVMSATVLFLIGVIAVQQDDIRGEQDVRRDAVTIAQSLLARESASLMQLTREAAELVRHRPPISPPRGPSNDPTH